MSTTVSPAPEDVWSEHDGLRFAHRILPNPTATLLPTLFVSGAFQTMGSWARFVRVFAPHTTVLLVDPPGVGGSDLLPADRGIDTLAACLEQLLDEHHVDQVNVVAASYGTPAAFRLAQLHPERVARVALVGTMKEIPAHLAEATQATVDLALARDRDAMAAAVVDGLLCRDTRLPVDHRDVAERVLVRGLLSMSDRQLDQYAANTRRLLAQEPLELHPPIEGPEALVFTGEHDGFTVPEHGREVARAFARSWFTVVERADHLLHLERFEVVCELLMCFLSGRIADPVHGCGPLTWEGTRVTEAARG